MGMEYKNVAVRNTAGKLMLKDGEARKGQGKLSVRGALEPGASLDVGLKYKITGEPGLGEELVYAGSPGSGTYDFKID